MCRLHCLAKLHCELQFHASFPESGEGLTSVMVDSVSSTVFGAQRVGGPSPSPCHLLSLPSCSSSMPGTSAATSSFVPSGSPSLATTPEATCAEESLETSSSSPGDSHPAAADSSATVSLRSEAVSNRDMLNCSGSLQVSLEEPARMVNLESSTGRNIDDVEVFGVGTSDASSSACEIILVGDQPLSTSEVVIAVEDEEGDGGQHDASAEPAASSEDPDVPSVMEELLGNSVAVSSSAALPALEMTSSLANGLECSFELASNSLPSGGVVDSGIVVNDSVDGTQFGIVERTVTSSASAPPHLESRPSTSRGPSVATEPVKRKRRVSAVMEEAAAFTPVHVSGWVRLASGLLDRVCRFRGASRPKGTLSPAHWFLEPGKDYATIQSS